MKRVFCAAVAISLAATIADAMPTDVDADHDGFASMPELRSIFRDITEEKFLEIDTDGDGLINIEEMLIAIKAKVIAKPDAYV